MNFSIKKLDFWISKSAVKNTHHRMVKKERITIQVATLRIRMLFVWKMIAPPINLQEQNALINMQQVIPELKIKVNIVAQHDKMLASLDSGEEIQQSKHHCK